MCQDQAPVGREKKVFDKEDRYTGYLQAEKVGCLCKPALRQVPNVQFSGCQAFPQGLPSALENWQRAPVGRIEEDAHLLLQARETRREMVWNGGVLSANKVNVQIRVGSEEGEEKGRVSCPGLLRRVRYVKSTGSEASQGRGELLEILKSIRAGQQLVAIASVSPR